MNITKLVVVVFLLMLYNQTQHYFHCIHPLYGNSPIFVVFFGDKTYTLIPGGEFCELMKRNSIVLARKGPSLGVP